MEPIKVEFWLDSKKVCETFSNREAGDIVRHYVDGDGGQDVPKFNEIRLINV